MWMQTFSRMHPHNKRQNIRSTMANQRGFVHLEVEKNGKNFSFSMPQEAFYGEAYDAMHEMLLELSKMAQTAAENVKRKIEN